MGYIIECDKNNLTVFKMYETSSLKVTRRKGANLSHFGNEWCP